jgi:acyl carrier protein
MQSHDEDLKNKIPEVNEIEKIMISVWESILKISPINKDSNYFELGANSLSIIKFVYELEERGFYFELTPNDVFFHQNISSLAASVRKKLAG